MLTLELYGTGIANRRVSAMWVVPSFDERKDRLLCLRRRGEPLSVERLAFLCG